MRHETTSTIWEHAPVALYQEVRDRCGCLSSEVSEPEVRIATTLTHWIATANCMCPELSDHDTHVAAAASVYDGHHNAARAERQAIKDAGLDQFVSQETESMGVGRFWTCPVYHPVLTAAIAEYHATWDGRADPMSLTEYLRRCRLTETKR